MCLRDNLERKRDNLERKREREREYTQKVLQNRYFFLLCSEGGLRVKAKGVDGS